MNQSGRRADVLHIGGFTAMFKAILTVEAAVIRVDFSMAALELMIVKCLTSVIG